MQEEEKACRVLPGGSCKHLHFSRNVTAHALMSDAHALAFPETEEIRIRDSRIAR